ncbi:MAG: hypothetical protein AB1489_06170 [Acidobacteriota bacterium]
MIIRSGNNIYADLAAREAFRNQDLNATTEMNKEMFDKFPPPDNVKDGTRGINPTGGASESGANATVTIAISNTLAFGANVLDRINNGRANRTSDAPVSRISQRTVIPGNGGNPSGIRFPEIAVANRFIGAIANQNSQQAANYLITETSTPEKKENFIKFLKVALGDPNGQRLIEEFKRLLPADSDAAQLFETLLASAAGQVPAGFQKPKIDTAARVKFINDFIRKGLKDGTLFTIANPLKA